MPMLDSNLQATWDRLYAAQPFGTIVHYERVAADAYLGNDPELLIAALESIGLLKSHRLVLVGAAYGWVCERFLAKGYGPMANGTANGKLLCVDTSTYIQANKSNNGNATLTILNADVNASTGRRTIRQQFGSNNAVVDWVVTEDLLTLLVGAGDVPAGNNEIVPLCQNLRSLATNVVHWTSVPTVSSDPGLNWKTAEVWKAWVTPDFVIQRGTATVL